MLKRELFLASSQIFLAAVMVAVTGWYTHLTNEILQASIAPEFTSELEQSGTKLTIINEGIHPIVDVNVAYSVLIVNEDGKIVRSSDKQSWWTVNHLIDGQRASQELGTVLSAARDLQGNGPPGSEAELAQYLICFYVNVRREVDRRRFSATHLYLYRNDGRNHWATDPTPSSLQLREGASICERAEMLVN